VERVGLDLVDRRRDLVVLDEVDEPVGVEVGDPDRPGPALCVNLLHGPPFAVVVAERLVDQVKVEVVETEPAQRGVEGVQGVVLDAAGRGVLDPQLRGDEQVVSGQAAGGDRGADGFLVAVRGGGVEVAVARLEGSFDGGLGLVLGDLEDPEADDGHRDAVVQLDGLHELSTFRWFEVLSVTGAAAWEVMNPANTRTCHSWESPV
jgi:hypothetical protein